MTRLTMTRRALCVLAGSVALLGASAALAQEKTFALVQINQQALFFNQMNEGAAEAAKAAGVAAKVEVYAGDHGWMVPDSPAYNAAAAAKGEAALLTLYKAALA